MSINEAKAKLKLYAKVLRQNKVLFSNLYLFGSYSTGKARIESDIDVAVVVKKIGKHPFELETKLWVLAPRADSRIEPILLEEKDMAAETASMMGEEVRKSGIKVV